MRWLGGSLMLAIVGLSGCNGTSFENKNDFSWNTKGEFKIACYSAQRPGKTVIQSDSYAEKMKSPAEALCGGSYELSDLTTRVKTGTNAPSEIELSIKFTCTPDPAVLKRAEAFSINAFCRNVI